ncbi:right-handed parallel beta-helix repeat-containing protein [Chondromyces crocatus]|uniref:Right handed beta helix domain-containing protein n=1 Tax=Chondromyces crocatus TaxID=52 RepID=A0A0K1ELN3_CHOCO|nr:right-handed parallel beta-helix repeat-containing protein [Chondromyces crocatus]AKT41779.1 uncharacterized protein CMC5_059900 [Chondromyces crocatus]
MIRRRLVCSTPLFALLCAACSGQPSDDATVTITPEELESAAALTGSEPEPGIGASDAEPGISSAGARQRYGCEPGGALPGHTYLFVDAAAAPGGSGARQAPFATLQAAYLAIQSGQKAILCIAEGTYVERVGSQADRFTSGTEYTLVGGFRAGQSFAERDSVRYRTAVKAPDRASGTLVFGNVRSLTLDGLDLSGGLHGVLIASGYSAGRTLVVRNNHIHDNGIEGHHDHRGGGLRLSGTQVVIEHNLIENNAAGAGGAGIFIGSSPSSERNTRIGGTLQVSPALATIAHNIVRDNVARYDTPHGAGISVSMNAHIHHNRIEGNRGHAPLNGAGGQGVGGGIIAQYPLITVAIESNWIARNVAPKAGGGIFIDEASIGTLVNNVIVDNQGVGAICVDGRGSGNAPDDRGYATIANNTVTGNSDGAVYVLDSTVTAYNNVFWANGARDILSATSGAIPEDITLDHNVLASGCTGPALCTLGAHNRLGEDPRLLDPARGDYHLAPNSPAVRAGTSALTPAFACPGALTTPPPDDYAGVARSTTAGIDLGAFAR